MCLSVSFLETCMIKKTVYFDGDIERALNMNLFNVHLEFKSNAEEQLALLALYCRYMSNHPFIAKHLYISNILGYLCFGFRDHCQYVVFVVGVMM